MAVCQPALRRVYKAKQEILCEHVWSCTLHTLKVLQRKKTPATSPHDSFAFNSLKHVQVQRKKRKPNAYPVRVYFFPLQRFCMAVLTHLNPPCWKWIWHMRNGDFGSYSAHLNHGHRPVRDVQNVHRSTARVCQLKCWYLRPSVVCFEIERRSNGSLKIKSI